MTQVFSQLGRIRPGLAVMIVVVIVSLGGSFVQQLNAQAMRSIAIAGPLSVTTNQSLEFVFALPVTPTNQPNPAQFRLLLQDAETGSIFGQKEIQVSGGIPGGGCLELTVDQGGHILIDGQLTNFIVPPGTRKAVVGMLIPAPLAGAVRFVAALQLFDNATQRTVAALPAVQ